MKKYTVFIIKGFDHDEMVDHKRTLYDVKVMEIITESEKNALKKAKTLIKCKKYECFGSYDKFISN
jgi:hypothetical protein